MTVSSEKYRVTIWDKQENSPYHVMEYGDEDTAKYVARRMRVHYVDRFADINEDDLYEIRLQRFQGE